MIKRKHYNILLVLLFAFANQVQAQVTTGVDTTSIRLGEQITLSFNLEADTTSIVVFPEGQAFSPLEVIESYPIDTVKNDAKYSLIKKYGLTKFDSGAYTIPRQPIAVGDKTVFTDSIQVQVFNVEVDSTKQGLYDIKPAIAIQKPASKWWLYLLIGLAVLALIAGAVYWFIWRKKPLTEEEKIALLPPYERAKLALNQLEEREHLLQNDIKQYYSELTLTIRRYLDEKVYDKALESTTDELVKHLKLLADSNKFKFTKSTIENIDTIFKRADLVKFAKSKPDIKLAKLDKETISEEIDRITNLLPEPDEDEKRLNEEYRLQQEQKAKRRKILSTAVIGILLLIITYVGFSLAYGFKYVFDTVTSNDTLELLENDWVDSAYGVPPVYISTPEVLMREQDSAKTKNSKTTTFKYGNLEEDISVRISTTKLNPPAPTPNAQQSGSANQPEVDLNEIVEKTIQRLEKQGAENIILKREQFTTPNGAEGLKTFGTYVFNNTNENYAVFHFVAPQVVQEVLLTWEDNNIYAKEIAERMINSIELTKVEE